MNEKTTLPGCFSISGIGAAFLVVLLVVAVGFFRGGFLFSPGPLNARSGEAALGGAFSHAAIGDCSKCHTAPWSSQTMADACLTCHTDFVQDPKNFHAVMMAQAKTRGCNGCHGEHQGPAGSLIRMDLQNFQHDQVGFSLKAHQKQADGSPMQCADCHADSYIRFDAGVCTACHTRLDGAFMQKHTAAFGPGCRGCHDGLDTYGKAFDHQRVAFPLKGSHASLDCGACHQGAADLAVLKATPVDCYACHAKDDSHQGGMGQACATCHTPDDWQSAKIDHAQTAFPLLGKHLTAACKDCHTNNVFKSTPRECVACHVKDDAHQGQYGQECGLCHTPTGWQPPSFDHAKSNFPLTGAHQNVTCKQCHTQGTAGTMVFKGTPTQCNGCHADPPFHQGLFGTDCASCHTTAAWAPAKFNQAHAFPLNHGNANNSCKACHPDSLRGYTCFSCHNRAQMEQKHQEEGISDLSNCLKCHPNGRGGG